MFVIPWNTVQSHILLLLDRLRRENDLQCFVKVVLNHSQLSDQLHHCSILTPLIEMKLEQSINNRHITFMSYISYVNQTHRSHVAFDKLSFDCIEFHFLKLIVNNIEDNEKE
jgi:hypothetical protein